MNLENKKQIAIIMLAVGLGLVSAVLTGNHIQMSIQKETKRLAQEFETKKMKPLLQDMEALRREMKEIASRPVQVVERKSDEAAKSDVPKSSLALRTPPGKRAYVVRIDSLAAVGGMINPGDYVDIIVHLDMPDPETGQKSSVSSIVFQNVQVLAVGTNLQAPGGYEQQQNARALNITFALSPEESSLMSFIERNGKMQLVLRAPSETETEILQTASWNALADYVFERQGTELVIPREKAVLSPVPTSKSEEVRPFIQIFQGGKQSK